MDIPVTTDIRALHLLRVTGSVARDELVAAAGADEVDGLVDRGLATATGTHLRLSALGREAHEQALAAELDERGCRPATEDCYRRFLVLNAGMLQACTDWQIRLDGPAPTPNDHRDAGYDAEVLARISALVADACDLLGELSGALPRFAPYAADLAGADAEVRAGNTDFVTNPRARCIHTVWFELHEDLLATLGIDRAAEEGHDAAGASR